MKQNKTLKDFMTGKQLQDMKGLPTYHKHCIQKTGVARPGKTAKELWKQKRGNPARTDS